MRRLALIALVLACNLFTPGAEPPPSVIVGTISANGDVKFDVVEEFRLGLIAKSQSTKIRLLPEVKGNVDPNQIKKLSKVELSQAGVLRGDGTGRVFRWNDEGTGREIALPDDYQTPKLPAKMEEIPGALTLSVLPNKKAKQTEAVDPKTFYALLHGSPPDRVVYEFVMNDKAFKSGLDEQLKAMDGFVKSFPEKTMAVEEFRVWLNRKMETQLVSLENGGPFNELVRTQRFGELATRAFPKDNELAGLLKKILERRSYIEATEARLPSLALAGEWDLLLEQYVNFERYQASFPSLVQLRQQAYQESARAHSRVAWAFRQREDHESAVREARQAQKFDPANGEIENLLEGEMKEFALVAARRAEAEHRGTLPAGSIEETQFKEARRGAERALLEKDPVRAETYIRDMARLNSEAPDVYFMNAQLLRATGKLADARTKLDAYDRMVTSPADRERSVSERSDLKYDIETVRKASQQAIDSWAKVKDYAALYQRMQQILASTPDDVNSLYYGGIAAAALRSDQGEKLLKAYREKSDSLAGKADMRNMALRVLNVLGESKPSGNEGTPNWMSGRRLPDNVYYCPETLASQIQIDNVSGNKVKWTFEWDKTRLLSVQATAEDVNAKRLLAQMTGGGALDAAGAADDPGSFFFRYLEPRGPLAGVRTRAAAKPAPGAANAPAAPKPNLFRVIVTKGPGGALYLPDDDKEPEIVFPSHPAVDISVLSVVEGAPLGTIVAGNSYFQPFLWTGLHYFSVQYDDRGRAIAAQERNVDNRLVFFWDDLRLKEIRAFQKDPNTPVYRRAINYKGSQIDFEEIFENSKSAGRITYIYAPNSRTIQSIKFDSNGKEWVAKPRS